MLLLGGERSIRGFVTGNIKDALNFSVMTKIIPMVEVFPLEQAALAYEKMMTAKVHFRSVLKIGQ
jgi:D-arabinose 1-dehydrogenase-like Zn-dependent alcohol dehydrogenase